VNTNPNRKRRPRRSRVSSIRRDSLSVPNELLWALIGLLLTIFSTFVEASIASWSGSGLSPQRLGVTYQIGAVLLTGCLGGKQAGLLSQIAYVFLGLTWLPVFAQGGGWGYLKEPSFGYILGFIPGAWLCGWLAFRSSAKLETLAFSTFCGLLAIHFCGLLYIVGLALIHPEGSHLTFPDSLPSTMINYSLLPFFGQLVVICVVVVIAFFFRKLLFY
jgi:biotin transport system substrate-specific component